MLGDRLAGLDRLDAEDPLILEAKAVLFVLATFAVERLHRLGLLRQALGLVDHGIHPVVDLLLPLRGRVWLNHVDQLVFAHLLLLV